MQPRRKPTMLRKSIKQLTIIFAFAIATLASSQETEPEQNPLVEQLKALVSEIETSGETMERFELLGDLHAQMGDPKRSVVAYQKAIQDFGGTENLYYKLARILLVANRPELCLEILKLGSSAFPESAPLKFELGKAYAAFGKKYAAEATLVKAVELDPENSMFRYHLALAFRSQEKWEKSMELVETLLAEGHEDEVIFLLKSDLLLMKGNEAAAVKVMQDLYNSHPDSSEAKRVLNVAYQQYAYKKASSGDMAGAIEIMEKVTELLPDSPEAHTGLGSYYQDAGDLENAEREFKHVIENTPDFLSIYFLYGRLLESTDRKAESMTILQAGLKRATELKNEEFIKNFKEVIALGK